MLEGEGGIVEWSYGEILEGFVDMSLLQNVASFS